MTSCSAEFVRFCCLCDITLGNYNNNGPVRYPGFRNTRLSGVSSVEYSVLNVGTIHIFIVEYCSDDNWKV